MRSARDPRIAHERTLARNRIRAEAAVVSLRCAHCYRSVLAEDAFGGFCSPSCAVAFGALHQFEDLWPCAFVAAVR